MYVNGQGSDVDPTPPNTPDDSKPKFQDVNPDTDLTEGSLIVDGDGPGANLGQYNSVHIRDNFRQHVVFNYLSKTPERVSSRTDWMNSLDFAYDYNNRAVFIYGRANDGDTVNEVRAGTHLRSLALNIPKAVLRDAYVTAPANRNIKTNQLVTVTVKGANLVGAVQLRKIGGGGVIPAIATQVRLTDERANYSDLTEARVRFLVPAPATNDQYELVFVSAAGESNAIGGFRMVD
jgi:hypothetical protein